MLAVNFTINVNGTFITIIRQKKGCTVKAGQKRSIQTVVWLNCFGSAEQEKINGARFHTLQKRNTVAKLLKKKRALNG